MREKWELLAALVSGSGIWGVVNWVLNKRLRRKEELNKGLQGLETEAEIIEKYRDGLYETQTRLSTLHAAFLAVSTENNTLKNENKQLIKKIQTLEKTKNESGN